MESAKILVVGLGGIGSFFCSRLNTLPGIQFSAICRSNYDLVRTAGIKVRSRDFGEEVVKLEHVFSSADDAKQRTQSDGLKWDYILVATKVLPDQLDPASLLDGLVDPEVTAIVLMQNGLGIEATYRKKFPTTTILSSVTRTSMEATSPNEFKHNFWTLTNIGPYGSADEDASPTAYQRNEQFADLLRRSGILDVNVLDHLHMQFARWHKTAINIAFNPVSVLTGGATIQALALDSEVFELQKGIMLEVLGAAEKVLGQPLPGELPTWQWVLRNATEDVSGSRPSMWADWEAGRQMEIEVILGEPLRTARSYGVDLPRTQSVYAMLKLLEKTRDRSK